MNEYWSVEYTAGFSISIFLMDASSAFPMQNPKIISKCDQILFGNRWTFGEPKNLVLHT